MGTLLMRRIFSNVMHVRLCASTTTAATGVKCSVGEKASATRCITADDVRQFARLSGDMNPIHLAAKMAVVHGALLNGLVSGVIGTQLPGAGALVVAQSLHFPAKCYAGEVVTTSVEVVAARKIIQLKFSCDVAECLLNGKPKCVLFGEAKVVQR